jgi:hypothetical protein
MMMEQVALDRISFDTIGMRLVVDGRLHGHDEKFGGAQINALPGAFI